MSELDFSNMTYDVTAIGNKNIIDAYPELADYEEFQDPKDNDLLKWVVILSDTNSPFMLSHKNFFKRGKAVYDYLKLKDNDLLEYIKDELPISKGHFRVKVQSMIYKYFIVMDENSYTTWLSLFLSFHELNMFSQIRLDFNDDKYEQKFKIREDILKQLPMKQKQLMEYEKVVFGDTKIKGIVAKQEAKVISWPEKMAKTVGDEMA